MPTMTITAMAVPSAPNDAQPLAYQHRARLLCPPCFTHERPRPRPYGGAIIPIPAAGRLAVARRLCAGCGVELAVPGLFGLGVLSATVGALDACAAGLTTPPQLFARHWTGDWGEISPEDYGQNEDAIRDGARILSVYHLQGGGRVWCITEAGRHATTLLTPDEY